MEYIIELNWLCKHKKVRSRQTTTLVLNWIRQFLPVGIVKKCGNFWHILLFLNVCKQTFYISHVYLSQKLKGVFMWNLQHIIFIWRMKKLADFRRTKPEFYASKTRIKAKELTLHITNLTMDWTRSFHYRVHFLRALCKFWIDQISFEILCGEKLFIILAWSLEAGFQTCCNCLNNNP